MASFELNGERCDAPEGSNLLLATHESGVEIPHLCYHPGLAAPANCRLCVAAIGQGGQRRLHPACDLAVSEGMVVDTTAPDVVKTREEALEFLLVGHALDCPVCAKAGECELQNHVAVHGRAEGRYAEEHHRHGTEELGPRVRLFADRCIGCTRCIRFCDEVAESGELTRVARGGKARVAVFPGRQLDNPLAGNVVDLCPVGALAEPQAHLDPPVWQLKGVDSLCPGCSTGCNVRVDVHRDQIVRIKPRVNMEVNRYWICDEGRYGWDDVHGAGRLTAPQVRRGEHLEEIAWDEALMLVDKRLALCGGEAIAVRFSAGATNEESFLLGQLARDIWKTGRIALCNRADPGGDRCFGDGFTIRADRAPNTRGAGEIAVQLGLEFTAAQDMWRDMAAGRVRAAFAVAGARGETLAREEREALSQVEFLVVLGTVESELSRLAAVVLPGATAFEKEGTFTNVDGRVQRIRAAVTPPGLARPDVWILAQLGKLGGMDWGAGDPAAVAAAIGVRHAAAMAATPEGYTGQAYGGGWSTWRQRRGFIHVEDHTKQVE